MNKSNFNDSLMSHFVKYQDLYIGLICIVLMIWSGMHVLDFFNGDGPSRIKTKHLLAPVAAGICAFFYLRRHFMESEDSMEETDEEPLAYPQTGKEDSHIAVDEQTAQQAFAEEELLNIEGSQLDEYDAEWRNILLLVCNGRYDEARERVSRYKNEAGCHRRKAEKLLSILDNS
ncbi:MAG: hypothetical protein J6O23_01650 [Prevotella sp.]|nr:hypothetical protein [Prevotella sp.]